MVRASAGALRLDRAPRRAHGAGHNRLLTALMCTIAVTAIVAVVTAAAMGQPTVALIIGLASAAFFFGALC